jgi:hypothetical protein
MRYFTRLAKSFAILMLVPLFTACGGGSTSGGGNPSPKVALYTISVNAGAGVRVVPPSAQVEAGKTATFALSLDAGYLLTSATGCNGVLNGQAYTTGPITGNGTVTFTTAGDIPLRPGKIAYVVAPDVLGDMPTLIQGFMDAVTSDTGCGGTLFQSPAEPLELRALLKNMGSDLRLAFLIGDVPTIKETIISPYGTFKDLSDHYYRALGYPYGAPYLDASGDTTVDLAPYGDLLTAFCPTNAVSRIKGLGPSTQLADIRRYLERNLLLRRDRTRFIQGFSFFSAAADGPIDGTKLLAAYQNHPLYGSGEITFMGKTSALALKQGFVEALASGKEHCEVNLHGSPQSVLFQGVTASDSVTMDAPEFGGAVINAKVVSLASCSTGDFTFQGYLAGQALFGAGSSALLVRANPAVTLYADSTFAREARMLDMALGVGRSYMDSYPTTFSGEPGHFYGDPTITLRTVDPLAARPKLVLQEKRHHQEFSEALTFQTVSLNGATVHEDLVFRNIGDKDLIIDGNCFSQGIDLDGTFPWGVNSAIPSFSAGSIYADATIQTDMDGSYTFNLAPGESKTIRVEYLPARLSDGTIPVGKYQGVMFFACNDPEIGSFRVDLVARTQ